MPVEELPAMVHVLVVPDRSRRESHAHLGCASEEQTARRENSVTQEAGGVVEENQIETVAGYDLAEPVEEPGQGRAPVVGRVAPDLNGDVDVAFRSIPAACERSEQVGELDFGKRRQRLGEPRDGIGVVRRTHG